MQVGVPGNMKNQGWTQGETLDDLMAHLRDLQADFAESSLTRAGSKRSPTDQGRTAALMPPRPPSTASTAPVVNPASSEHR